MRLAAGPGYGNTMEVRQIGVDNRAIGHAIEIHAGRRIVLARAMQPDPVHNDVVDGAEGSNKRADESCSPFLQISRMPEEIFKYLAGASAE